MEVSEQVKVKSRPSLYILSGISGSGKSTFATDVVKNDKTFIRVNRDSLRLMTSGSNWDSLRHDPNDKSTQQAFESYITSIHSASVIAAGKAGYNVIWDDTNLRFGSILSDYKKLIYNQNTGTGIFDAIYLCIFPCDLENSIKWNRQRNPDKIVNVEAIENQAKVYKNSLMVNFQLLAKHQENFDKQLNDSRNILPFTLINLSEAFPLGIVE